MNNKTHSPARVLRTSARLFSIFVSATALAQTAPSSYAPAVTGTTVQLEAYVVSASRTQQNIKLTPSSVTSLALSALDKQQVPDLRTALQLAPGVNTSETGGAAGSKTSINIRGAGANQTLFLIDGIRMNAEDWTSGYTTYLGASGLSGFDRIEILRGPQSTLYGSAAMGGVVSLETARGSGAPHGAVSIDAGSFDTIGANISVAGASPVITQFTAAPQTLGYSASFGASYTGNDRDYNTFKQVSGSTRIEYQLAGRLTAGFTYRGLRSSYEEPGPTYDPTQAGAYDLNIDIATLYADWKPLDTFNSRLTYGWLQNIYDWDSAYPSYAHSTRNVLDWQNTWQALDQLQIVAGANAEWSLYDSGDKPERERLASLYLNAVANPVKNLELTAGVRGDDYSTFDAHATWRTGASYRIEKTNTTVRATYGTGFNAPAPQYVYGSEPYYLANPDLQPEKSKGWDIGIEQDLWRDRITAGATFFRNDFSDKLQATPVGSKWQYHNLPGATTKGVETYLYTRPIDDMNAQLTYTYLDTRDNTGARLIRQPRHILAADINYQFTDSLHAGIGISWIGGRPDESYNIYDPVTWASTTIVEKMPDYVTVRAYASYNLCANLKLKLRLENLFDKKYETIAGYPGLPFGAYGGIEWKF